MRGQREGGFSLIEVVIALGLLAGVLISISGLFILGGKQVKSGRTASEALAVGREVLEQMNNWGFKQTYEAFGCTATNTTCTVDTRTSTQVDAQAWQATLSSKIGPNGYAIVTISSLVQSGGPPALNATKALRVEVVVNWTENGVRSRNVKLGTVRL